MSILTVPERLAKMLVDCHEDVNAAYYFTQESIDQLERPCWLIFVESANYPQTSNSQEQVEQNYSLAFVGGVFNAGGYINVDSEYELQARQIAESAVLYLLRHQNCQMSNENSKFESSLPSLDGVTMIKIQQRSAVTLYNRDGVDGGAFWGFTIDILIYEQLAYEALP